MNTQKLQRYFGKRITIIFLSITIAIVPVINSSCASYYQSLKSPVLATKITSAGTIIDVVSANSTLKTLEKALKAANLVEMLSSKSQFTVFAPSDAAFTSLPKESLENLLKPEKKANLYKILTNHVIRSAIDSKNLKSVQMKTVEGGTVTIKIHRVSITVDEATITKPDLKASNGVIHVINKVLLPPGLKL